MTEGPETTYLAAYISKYFKHKRLRAVQIQSGRYKRHGAPVGFRSFMGALPLRLLNVVKKGKLLCLIFEQKWHLLVRLGMTGWFSKPEDEPIFASNPHIIFEFQHTDLEFFDFRNFGTLLFTQDVEIVEAELNRLAPDILDSSSTATRLVHHIRTMDMTAKQLGMTLDEALMDQTFLISGIGNIIKSELLYNAAISPLRTVESLKKEEWLRLFHSARIVSKKVLSHLEKKELDWDSYFSMHAVYQKKKDPAGHPVVSYKGSDDRTTYWVPLVQS